MDINKRFENYPQPEDYIPSNQPFSLCDCPNFIDRGCTSTQTFVLPFDYSNVIKSGVITYKQGLYVVLQKELSDESVQIADTETDNTSEIKVTLSEDETLLFKPSFTMSPVEVQIKLTTEDNQVFTTDVFRFVCRDSLDLAIK